MIEDSTVTVGKHLIMPNGIRTRSRSVCEHRPVRTLKYGAIGIGYKFSYSMFFILLGVWAHVMWVLSPRHGASTYSEWRRRPANVKDSCEYIE